MLPVWPLQPGAPGVFRDRDVPLRMLTGVRMDVCAFVGVAPRGPAREAVLDPIARDGRPDSRVRRQLRRTVPVAVESFDEYRELFGSFEGSGLLPYAVASFFEQGGRKAYIARIVHDYGDGDPRNEGGVASGLVGGASTGGGAMRIRARNEGTWGNQLRVSIAFQFRPVRKPTKISPSSLGFELNAPVTVGSLLRLGLSDGTEEFRVASRIIEQAGPAEPNPFLEVTLDQSIGANIDAADVCEADFTVQDAEGRREIHVGQGLSSLHPRWLGATLAYESRLVMPDAAWLHGEIRPAPLVPGKLFEGGADRQAEIVPEDFFDPRWTPGDDEPGNGVMSLTHLSDLSLLVTPDLYSPGPLATRSSVIDPGPLSGPTFQPCVDAVAPQTQEIPVPDLDGLRLDPRTDFDEIEDLQSKLVDFAIEQRSFIVLLDVPPGVSHRQILSWRNRFDSAYAAAYHPWLQVSRPEDERDELIRIPPSAVAAGIIARREHLYGVPHGPANELASEVVNAVESVSPVRHDELHPLGINVYLRERDGIRLTGARTLSRDAIWRQLNVRRLVTMIARSLQQQTQWIVFEPNGPLLRSEISRMLNAFLRELFRAGAFTGATEDEAFFVRCDADLNPRRLVEAGQVIAHIGLAPSEPVEYIVLRLTRQGDGTLLLEDFRRM